MTARIHDRLTLICLSPEQHLRTCNYWYLLQSRATAYTAFRTREALEFFLDLHHLELTKPLPADRGTHAFISVEGITRERMHGTGETMPTDGRRILQMSNGDYTLGIVEEDAEGAIIHYIGPNGSRIVFDPAMSRAHEDAGHKGPMGHLI